MKIAIDCRMSGKSGIGGFLDGILPYLMDSGNELLLIGGNIDVAGRKNVSCLSCDIGTFSIKETFFFPKALSRRINECDLYFTPYCNIPSGIKIPIYSTIHDIVFLDVKGLSGRLGTFARKLFYKHAIRKSKLIFTVSEFSKNRIIEKLHCRKPLTVVYGGVPQYLLDFDGKKVDKDKSLIFIGNIKHHKGLQTLLPAFTKFREGLTSAGKGDAKLVIVGSKDNFRTQDNSFDSYIQAGEENGIEFTGYLSDQELLQRLTRARILVQPSLYEGFGMPPLQALYVGTRALISDIPVFKEIYKDLPVTFFHVSDEEDLQAQLQKMWDEPDQLPAFERIYSFERTASLIMKAFD
ncbi:MAG: glycosyltransferase family 4 protein [Treponema sp.]|nr:glycosyltransferase family 4 protein [Treponema sp.]